MEEVILVPFSHLDFIRSAGARLLSIEAVDQGHECEDLCSANALSCCLRDKHAACSGVEDRMFTLPRQCGFRKYRKRRHMNGGACIMSRTCTMGATE